MVPALFLALTLAAAPAPAPDAEPLPAGAPTDAYQLTAWCYGAMSEYLDIYNRVKPELVRMDRMFGTSVPGEKEPYSADMAAARVELKVLAGAVEAAEKASAQPIAPQGVAAIKLGQSIWRPAEEKPRRQLADAWMTWALPDRCDVVARQLAARSALLGKALTYNAGSTEAPEAAAPAPAPAAPPPTPAPSPPQDR